MSNRCFAAKFRSEFRSKVPVSLIQQPKLHRFNLAQYYELGELGLLNQRTELLDGIITDMEPIGPWHANIGDILSRIFNERAQGRFRVRVRYPINLGQMSQPQPDLVLYRPGIWRGQHPGAADISLLIEISDTSLVFDLGEKLALYMAAGIQEYWVIDLQARQVHCFIAPDYKRRTLRDSISPTAWPDIRIDLVELFA
jgi:Uma2 family endonuclease